MYRSLIAFALLTLAGPDGAAQGRHPFTVAVETPTGEPIAGASVLVGERGAQTDAEGEAVFEGVAPGRYRLRVSFVGRRTQEAAARLDVPGPWRLVVEMAESETQLGDVVVRASDLSNSRLIRDGFLDRQWFGGTTLTPEDIRRKNPNTFGDALQGLPNVQVRTKRVRGGLSGDTPGRQAVTIRFGAPCPLHVFLDGTHSPWLTENVDAMPADDIAVIEVYRGAAQIPPMYNRMGQGGGCGVILAWTSTSLRDYDLDAD